MAEREELLRLAANIVSAHASNNALPADQLPELIQQVFSALATAQQSAATPPRPEPAVSVKASVHQNHLVCLDCGRHLSMLKRHLMTDHQLTPDVAPTLPWRGGHASTPSHPGRWATDSQPTAVLRPRLRAVARTSRR